MTLADLLKKDDLPLPVKDFLEKVVSGRPLPYADRIDEDDYYLETELFVAVLADHIVTNTPLPEAARDYVEEFLYRLEEATEIHIWNTPEVLRAAYPAMMNLYRDGGRFFGEYSEGLAAKAALKNLCTRRELMEFYARHGIEDNYKGRSELAGSAPLDNPTDQQQALKAARILADPRTPAETRDKVHAAINELLTSTQVTPYHPALVERALTLMLETVEVRAKTRYGFTLSSVAERRKDRQRLFDLLDSIKG
jgi:hypothetical protein